ncbi:MAG TPA: hypothetical protein VNF26_12520 [Candidatus Baltobacterales bacterium]|nr:hypothetical protein [Candidatus Baltobacterales bacterium]
MEILTAVLGGFVGALIGLLIALVGQSREDDRLRRAEAWRQQTAKQVRLRDELATALRLVYAVAADTGIFRWVPPSQASKDPNYAKRRAEIDALYEETRAADIRLRLEGATIAWRPLADVAREHQRFRDALNTLDEPQASAESRAAARTDLGEAHKAISGVAETLHETFATYLDALTPPGPPPAPSGLRSWLRQAEEWMRS